MSNAFLVRFCVIVVVIHAVASPAWAYKRQSRVPLLGCGGYYAASGSAKSFEIRRVAKESDREELIIEVKNVPITPGTKLKVFVGDEEIGSITLDAKQSGQLKLTSDSRHYVPMIDAGTSIQVRRSDGRLVLQ